MRKRTDDNPVVEVSSPACSMHEADDAYMGYAGRDELVAFLDELLEVERASARIALESARTAGAGPIAELLQAIQRDETRWCTMLLSHIEALGGTPSPRSGLYDEAIAIADLGARITFLARGQARVVRRLRENLPRLRDDRLHADLLQMLRSYEATIALASKLAGPPGARDTPDGLHAARTASPDKSA